MSADSWAASARRAAGAVHRPSVTVARVADPAEVDALAVAAADVAALTVRWAPPACGDAVAAPAELQATIPAISRADPATSARIPIAHRSISCVAWWYCARRRRTCCRAISDSYISAPRYAVRP